jgi:hypothetical protein
MIYVHEARLTRSRVRRVQRVGWSLDHHGIHHGIHLTEPSASHPSIDQRRLPVSGTQAETLGPSRQPFAPDPGGSW